MSNIVETTSIGNTLFMKRQLLMNTFDMIGDSRTQNVNVVSSGNVSDRAGLSAFNWFNWGNMLAGNPAVLGRNYGFSGDRPDQYLARYIDDAVASPSGWLIFNFPIVNALAQAGAGFTAVDGTTSVTTANVAQWCYNTLKPAWLRALASGKKVILVTEPGAENMSQTQTGCLHEFNVMLRSFAEVTPGVYLIDFNPVLWTNTVDTGIRFKTGMLLPSDPTHSGPLGGYTAGKVFANFLSKTIPFKENPMSIISDRRLVNPRQMILNPMFNTLTGGVLGGNTTVTSGNIPGSLGISTRGTATSSVVITSAPRADGLGNEVFFEVTMGSTAGNFQIEPQGPNVSTYELTDKFDFGFDLNMISNPGGASVYGNFQFSTDKGTNEFYALYVPATGVLGITSPYTVSLKTDVGYAKAASVTKSYVAFLIQTYIPANTTVKFGLSRLWAHKKFTP